MSIRILVANQNQDFCSELAEFLDRLGCMSLQAHSIAHAKSLGGAIAFDFCLIDLSFDGESALPLVSYWQENPAKSPQPILMIDRDLTASQLALLPEHPATLPKVFAPDALVALLNTKAAKRDGN